jgi:hypothetical protein
VTQEQKLIECERCKKAGVIKQYIDFDKVGENPVTHKGIYLIYDHGTKNPHVNKKACTYGCNTVIVWDTSENRYRDFEGGLLHDSPCEGVERYAGMAERQSFIIDSLRRSQMIAEKPPVPNPQPEKIENTSINTLAEAPNPIQKIAESTSPTEMSKTINFMWTMIKEIDRKVTAFEQLKHDRGVMLDAIDKRFDSIDKLLADMLTKIEPIKKQFKPGSELLKDVSHESHQPTDEELKQIFSEDEDLH